MSQKRYNQEFKQTVVELYRSGTPVSQLSSEYGVSEVTIYKWIKQLSPIECEQELTLADIKKAIQCMELMQETIAHIQQLGQNSSNDIAG